MKIVCITIVSILFILCHLSFAYSQTQEQKPSFNISLNKTNYFVGEPIEITFNLTNQSSKTIKGIFPLGFEYINPDVFYNNNARGFIRYISRTISPGFAREYGFLPEKLLSGQSKSITETLIYSTHPGSLVLSAAGQYQFQAKYAYLPDGKGTKLESNIVTITVTELPSIYLKKLESWKDPILLSFLQGDYNYMSAQQVQEALSKARNFLQDSQNDDIYVPALTKGLLKYFDEHKELLTEEERQLHNQLLTLSKQ